MRCFFQGVANVRECRVTPSAAADPTHGYCRRHLRDGRKRAGATNVRLYGVVDGREREAAAE